MAVEVDLSVVVMDWEVAVVDCVCLVDSLVVMDSMVVLGLIGFVGCVI